MKFGSLFAGIGGFDLGLERAGMECAWQVEIDPYCQKVLAKHWPNVERFADVRECGKHNLSAVDLICGGFPCQPFSTAGKQRGSKDDRYLWPEMLRIVREIKPSWVIGENVPGIIGMAIDDVLASLENEGYTSETFIIPACSIGAPHRRDRVWILAHCNSSSGSSEQGKQQSEWASISDRSGSKDVTYAAGLRCLRAEYIEEGASALSVGAKPYSGSEGSAADAYGAGLDERKSEPGNSRTEQPSFVGTDWETGEWWAVEPELGRVANGIPHRVDRLRALGNAVVPQVVELIGRAILAADRD